MPDYLGLIINQIIFLNFWEDQWHQSLRFVKSHISGYIRPSQKFLSFNEIVHYSIKRWSWFVHVTTDILIALTSVIHDCSLPFAVLSHSCCRLLFAIFALCCLPFCLLSFCHLPFLPFAICHFAVCHFCRLPF